MMPAPVILVIGASGLEVAHRILPTLEGATIHGLSGRIAAADVAFKELAPHLRELFGTGTPVIGICAAGILIRILAGCLADKMTEPPVVAVAEDGSAVVPLLGGHHGANDLASQIGKVLDISPAITSASDLRFGIVLEQPPEGWILSNPEDVKYFTSDLLAGATVRLDGAVPSFITESGIESDLGGVLKVSSTPYVEKGDARHLVYHPACVAIGVGCERGTEPEELVKLARTTLANRQIALEAIAGVYSLDLKADEPAIHALAESLGVQVRFFKASTLEAQTARLKNPSDAVYREVGCHGVSEAAALAAAGEEATLIVEKTKSPRATFACALAPSPISVPPESVLQGQLIVIGTGPGGNNWLTAQTEIAIEKVTDLVGYSLYLDLLGGRTIGKTRHDFPLGKEVERVRTALELASMGKTVGLVSSGDPGVYAMATLAFELLDKSGREDWGRVFIEVCPGISALQAAAARSGAPLGHDFCTISLSNLLTSWTVIERRLKAAANGDFVIALYNPVSLRRHWQLAEAKEILLGARPKTTPVVIARNLGREDENVRFVTLNALDPKEIDMLTVVLVGSSETKMFSRGDGRRWVYTPRGYPEKSSMLGN